MLYVPIHNMGCYISYIFLRYILSRHLMMHSAPCWTIWKKSACTSCTTCDCTCFAIHTHLQQLNIPFSDYMDSDAVTQQVNMIKSRPNLLLWYTADEPDGTSDPLNATSNAYDLIYSLDGYHPVSLVLNCQDYEFASQSSGADIVLQDTFMISNNVTFSSEWHTPCNT